MKSSFTTKKILAASLLLFFASNNSAQSFNFKPFSNSSKKANSTASATQAASGIHDKWAVLIGISNFKDANIAPIKYGAESASKLARTMLEQNSGGFRNDHMVVLLQDDATKPLIEDVLTNGIASKCLPTDVILVYISSRWMPSKSGKEMILCCNDTKVSNAAESGIDLVNIITTIRRRTQCRNILCLLDLSPVKEGTATEPLLPATTKGKPPQVSVIARLADLTGVNIFSANNLTTSSAQTPFTESSYFCRFLMEDLKGSSGTATIGTLLHMVTDQVHVTVQAEQKAEQVPEGVINNEPLTNIAFGLILNKQKPVAVSFLPASLANAKFGIDSGRMPIDHPELLPGSGIGIPVSGAKSVPPRKSYVAQGQQLKTQPPQPAEPSVAQPAKTTKPPRPTEPTQTIQPPREEARGKDEKDDDDDQPSQDLDLTPYISAAKKSIQAKWQPPKGLENHKVVTIFTINRDGTIQDPQIVEPSGIALVDQAALDALKAASPLPALPAGSPRSVQLRYKFEWKIRRD